MLKLLKSITNSSDNHTFVPFHVFIYIKFDLRRMEQLDAGDNITIYSDKYPYCGMFNIKNVLAVFFLIHLNNRETTETSVVNAYPHYFTNFLSITIDTNHQWRNNCEHLSKVYNKDTHTILVLTGAPSDVLQFKTLTWVGISKFLDENKYGDQYTYKVDFDINPNLIYFIHYTL